MEVFEEMAAIVFCTSALFGVTGTVVLLVRNLVNCESSRNWPSCVFSILISTIGKGTVGRTGSVVGVVFSSESSSEIEVVYIVAKTLQE